MEEFNIKEELIKLFEKAFFDSIETQRVLSDIFVLTEIIISRIKEKELEIKFVFLDEKKSDLSEEYLVKKLDISNIYEDFEEKNHEFFERELKNLLADLCKKEELKALNKINSVPIVYRNLYGKNKEVVQKEYFSGDGYEIGDNIFTWIDYSSGTTKLLSELKYMKGKDLSGMIFDGSFGLKAFADFTDINLEEAILKDVKIIYGILNNTNFSNADMEGFEISQIHDESLISADMSGANLKNAILNDINLRKINLTGANLEGADLSFSNMAHKDFRGMNLKHVRFNNSNLNGVDFRTAQLEGTKFYNSNLKGANFEGTNMNKVEIYNCNLENCTFDNSKMSEISISQSKCCDSSFYNIKIEKCKTFSGDLQNMDWSKKDFSGADMSCSDLRNTNLDFCKFDNTDLSYVNFSGAHLKNVDFSKSDLTGAVFISVEISGANFDGAETKGMKIYTDCAQEVLNLLDQEQKKKVIIID